MDKQTTRTALLIAGVIVLAFVTCGLYVYKIKLPTTSQQASQTPASDTSFASSTTTTYVNTSFNLSITYPSSWVKHTAPYAVQVPPEETTATPAPDAQEVFLGPQHLASLCNVIEPVTPARYIEIHVRNGTLAENRNQMNSKIAGQNYIESVVPLAGEDAYLYQLPPSYYPNCPDGSSQTTEYFLISHHGKVFSVSTEMAQLSEVQRAIASMNLF